MGIGLVVGPTLVVSLTYLKNYSLRIRVTVVLLNLWQIISRENDTNARYICSYTLKTVKMRFVFSWIVFSRLLMSNAINAVCAFTTFF